MTGDRVTGFAEFWSGLSAGSRRGLIVGAVLIAVGTVALGFWAMRADREVLFGHLSDRDAATLVHELEQMKVPYALADGGASILVDKSEVLQTRLKLMGRDVPLQGTVGFELFNNSDFGLTEFAQKVNYQRALQGELTRTILSLSEVERVRVHVTLPEDSLFRREPKHAKASVTLKLRDGRVLRREQVSGIQRLVAAAVPNVDAGDVTVVNEQGVALAGGAATSGEGDSAGSRIDAKRDIEQYLANKANAVLERTFGPGQALATVDVTLDGRQLKVTTEDVTGLPAAKGELPTGFVARERETTRDAGPSASGNPGTSPGVLTTQRETDYQLGRRVEQANLQPGSVVRLQAVVVVKAALNAAQLEQVRQLLSAAVGATPERGDVVVVQSMAGLIATVSGPASDPLPSKGLAWDEADPVEMTHQGPQTADLGALTALWLVPIAIAAAVAWLLVWLRRRARLAPKQERLTDEERLAQLARIQAWLAADAHPQPGGEPQR